MGPVSFFRTYEDVVEVDFPTTHINTEIQWVVDSTKVKWQNPETRDREQLDEDSRQLRLRSYVNIV